METDNDLIYDIFGDKEFNKLMYLSLNDPGLKIVEIIHYLYKDRFNCTKNNIWYQFSNHKWTMCAPISLKLILSVIPKYYTAMIDFYKNIQILDTIKKGHVQNIIDKIINIINNLETLKESRLSFNVIDTVSEKEKSISQDKISVSKNNMMQDLCSIFYSNDINFENNLNKKNKNLIGFDNGVYDLENNEFRAGRPDDYITMTVCYDYIKDYTSHKNSLLKFLEDIQPDKEERDYLLKYTATGLSAENNEKLIAILIGSGLNGRSKYKELLDYTLGQYFLTYPYPLLTKQLPTPDCNSSELLAFNNKRFALGTVLYTKINARSCKYLSSGETISSTKFHDKNITQFDPTHKFGIICGGIPSFDNNNDPSMWENVRCIKFPITFVDNPHNIYERKIDRNLSQKIKFWKQDFMLLLIEKYNQYKKEGVITTDKIIEFTNGCKNTKNI